MPAKNPILARLDDARAALRRRAPAAVVRGFEAAANDPWIPLRLSIRLSAFCTFASLLISRDLWFQEDRLYLPAPLISAFADAPPSLNLWLYLMTLACCVALFIAPQWRRVAFLLAPLSLFFVLQDQLRGQFFLYMYVFNLLIAAALPRRISDSDLDPLRFMTIGVYFWGGFYKLNLYFIDTLFPWFVAPWMPFADVARGIGLLVPFLEMGIGLCLLYPPTRWIGQIIAAGMLAVVLLSIGPLGHNQALTVWPTNVYIDCLAVFLFLNKAPLLTKARIKKPLALVAALLFLLLPAAGMTGAIGHHQSFKLYCCVHYGEIEFAKREDLSFLPEHLATVVVSGNRLPIPSITFAAFGVCASPVAPSDTMYLDGAKGFCPRLSRPKEARLHIVEVPHFWSSEKTRRTYDLCAPEPRLLEAEK